MATSNAEVHKKTSNNDTEDLTAPYYELEAFNSIWQALKWQEVRTRVPICLKKTIRSRYFYANLVYLAYAIGILIIDFDPNLNGSSNGNTTDMCDDNTTTTSGLDQPVDNVPLVIHLYTGN